MVKKVGGTSKGPGSTSPIEKAQPVQSSGVESVQSVGKAQQKEGAARIRRPTRPMTAAEREHLFQLIQEEADKMFGGPNGLPESKRKVVEGAVRMTVDAAISDDEE